MSKKNAINRRTKKQISNESQFSAKLDKLFDIAHDEKEKKLRKNLAILANQRDGRIGYVAAELR